MRKTAHFNSLIFNLTDARYLDAIKDFFTKMHYSMNLYTFLRKDNKNRAKPNAFGCPISHFNGLFAKFNYMSSNRGTE